VQTTVRSAGLTFVNVHLESGKDGDLKRLQALKTITNTCPTSALAIVGDTNMRVADEESLERLDSSERARRVQLGTPNEINIVTNDMRLPRTGEGFV